MVDFYEVEIRRIRGESFTRKELRGHIVGLPQVGNTMLLLEKGTGVQMVTSSVSRILWLGDRAFVETLNSLYQIKIGDVLDIGALKSNEHTQPERPQHWQSS